jgi:hypothetical protein
VPDGVSYFSRFTVKFIEISAAGVATAVSGYLIAHVSGFLSSPAPPPILPAPNAGEVTVNRPAPPSAGATTVNNPAAPSLPVQSASPGQPAPPAPPVSTEANETHAAPAQEVATPAKPPARPTVSAAPARKRGARDTGTAESKPSEPAEKPRDAAQAKPREPAEKPHDTAETKPHEPAEKPRDTAETKPHEPAEKPRDTAESKPVGDGKPRDWESVEARVRAALANAAANRPATADAPPRQADVPQPPPAVTVQPPPAAAVQPRTTDDPSVANAAAAPNAASPEPPVAAAVPPAPSKPEPLPAVEIKSRPVADVEAVPPTQAAAAPAEAETQGEPTDLVSAIRKLPEILRNDKPVPAGEAPRPPMPVGQ